jgi:hypothetical protein
MARRLRHPPELGDGRAPVGQTHPAEGDRDLSAAVVLVGIDGRRQHALDGAPGRQEGILGHVADPDAALDRAGAPVGGLEAGENPEERGLAGAIGAHETRLVAFEERTRQVFEEHPGPVGLADRLAAEQR